MTVHPHVCGELKCCHGKPGEYIGSSPRVWGTRKIGGGFTHAERFIPTCVGNSLYYLYD